MTSGDFANNVRIRRGAAICLIRRNFPPGGDLSARHQRLMKRRVVRPSVDHVGELFP
jgi:hypothetical protein